MKFSPSEAGRVICESEFEGVTFTFAVPDSVLRAAPQWRVEARPPPCSPNDAVVAAIKEAKELRLDIVAGWQKDSIELREVWDGCWVYVVRLYRSDFVMGLPDILEIPVLMTGQALHPVTQHRITK